MSKHCLVGLTCTVQKDLSDKVITACKDHTHILNGGTTNTQEKHYLLLREHIHALSCEIWRFEIHHTYVIYGGAQRECLTIRGYMEQWLRRK